MILYLASKYGVIPRSVLSLYASRSSGELSIIVVHRSKISLEKGISVNVRAYATMNAVGLIFSWRASFGMVAASYKK